MWPAIARTRRRLFGAAPADLPDEASHHPHPSEPGGPASPTAPSGPPDDVVLTIGRTELDRLGTALQALLGPETARPDTPARLEEALAAAVERLGGGGRPRVARRPAGLYTPEAWQVRLTSVDPTVAERIRAAARGAGFAR